MIKTIRIFSFFIIGWLFLAIFIGQAQASAIPAPLITKISGEPPLVSGEAKANTEIQIYLDNKFIGYASTKAKDNRTEIFNYQVASNLTQGLHKAMVIAKDKTSLILSPPSKEIFFYTGSLPAPTLIEPNEKTVTGKVKPLIVGLTVTNTLVKIFIDGVYNGKTAILNQLSGTANFSYKPFLNLKPGWHEVQTQAEDSQGRKSELSAAQNFKIELPMPAPTMYQPVVNNKTMANRPFIVGLAKNGSKVKIFIDKKLVGQFLVTNHPSGTANLAYQPSKTLTKGGHLVYTTATDNRGKESIWSNIIYFTIAQPSIAQAAAEEKKETVAKITEPQQGKEQPLAVSPEEGKIKQATGTNQGLAGIVGQTEEKEQTGAINEAKQNQSGIQLNVIIFIIFLVGIVAWLIWVNRELVKERKANEQKQINPEITTEPPKEDKDKLL